MGGESDSKSGSPSGVNGKDDVFVEITAEKVGQIIGTAVVAALAGGSTITFAITRVWRLFKKEAFHKNTGNVVQNVACAAEESIKVTEQLREIVEEMRDNAAEERDIFKDILSAQQQIAASNHTILEQLRTLITMRTREL